MCRTRTSPSYWPERSAYASMSSAWAVCSGPPLASARRCTNSSPKARPRSPRRADERLLLIPEKLPIRIDDGRLTVGFLGDADVPWLRTLLEVVEAHIGAPWRQLDAVLAHPVA